jgi:hypothetical protein
MRISLLFGLSLILSVASFADDTDSAPTPPNQNEVQVEKSPPKGSVTSVQSQSAGVHTGSGSLDPSQQSSMGLGIQIPFHKEKQTPPPDVSGDISGDSPKQ